MVLAAAGAPWSSADDLDHEEARRAVESGELRPLSEILASIAKEFGGKVLEVELGTRGLGRAGL